MDTGPISNFEILRLYDKTKEDLRPTNVERYDCTVCGTAVWPTLWVDFLGRCVVVVCLPSSASSQPGQPSRSALLSLLCCCALCVHARVLSTQLHPPCSPSPPSCPSLRVGPEFHLLESACCPKTKLLHPVQYRCTQCSPRPRPRPRTMGQKRRPMFSRSARLARLLYPGVTLVPRSTWCDPIGVLSVLYVLSIIFGGWYLVVPCTLLRSDYHPWSTLSFAALLIFFHTSLLLTIYCYLLASFVDPGPVPDAWRPVQRPTAASKLTPAPAASADAAPDDDCGGVSDDSGEDYATGGGGGGGDSVAVSLLGEAARKRESGGSAAGGGIAPVGAPQGAKDAVPPPAVEACLPPGKPVRFCRQCRIFKPARTHHCGTCRRCVLLFDHHCFFMRSNCIGFYNRKFFILFVGYASLSCGLVSVISPMGLLAYINDVGESTAVPVITKLVLLLLAYMMCFLHAIVLAGFGAYHIYLVCRNVTTLEHSDLCEEDSGAYNRGVAKNWRATFGTHPALWFVPVGMYRDGDGIRWRFVEDVL